MSVAEAVVGSFRERFGVEPGWLVRAPGRVNLIGEHTDYNDGFVLPMAIDRAVWIALRRRSDRVISLHALDLDEVREFDLAAPGGAQASWLDYVKGVAVALQDAGFALSTGFEGTLAGDVPPGAGLSSSAALEMAAARALAAVCELAWEPVAMARVGQRAENEFVGVSCGIMDQLISAAGRADAALLIDCRSLQTDLVPLPPAAVVVVLDTGTRRGLQGSEYNERRESCGAAARHFGVRALRDIDLGALTGSSRGLEQRLLRRARHVVSENARTLAAAAAMRRGDAAQLGELMNESHESLARDFEVSSEALDRMVECARAAPGCLGARMTGAGFGGCAVALVQADAVESFRERTAKAYMEATDLAPTLYICQASNGAEVVSISS